MEWHRRFTTPLAEHRRAPAVPCDLPRYSGGSAVGPHLPCSRDGHTPRPPLGVAGNGRRHPLHRAATRHSTVAFRPRPASASFAFPPLSHAVAPILPSTATAKLSIGRAAGGSSQRRLGVAHAPKLNREGSESPINSSAYCKLRTFSICDESYHVWRHGATSHHPCCRLAVGSEAPKCLIKLKHKALQFGISLQASSRHDQFHILR